MIREIKEWFLQKFDNFMLKLGISDPWKLNISFDLTVTNVFTSHKCFTIEWDINYKNKSEWHLCMKLARSAFGVYIDICGIFCCDLSNMGTFPHVPKVTAHHLKCIAYYMWWSNALYLAIDWNKSNSSCLELKPIRHFQISFTFLWNIPECLRPAHLTAFGHRGMSIFCLTACFQMVSSYNWMFKRMLLFQKLRRYEACATKLFR